MLIIDEQLTNQIPGVDPVIVSYINEFIESNIFPKDILSFLLNFESINGVDMSGEYVDEVDSDYVESRESDMEIKTRVFFETIVYMYSRELSTKTFKGKPLPNIIADLSASPDVRVYFYQMLINKGRTLAAEA